MQGAGPYAATIKKLEADIVDEMKKVNELIGVCGACPTLPESSSSLMGLRPDSGRHNFRLRCVVENLGC